MISLASSSRKKWPWEIIQFPRLLKFDESHLLNLKISKTIPKIPVPAPMMSLAEKLSKEIKAQIAMAIKIKPPRNFPIRISTATFLTPFLGN